MTLQLTRLSELLGQVVAPKVPTPVVVSPPEPEPEAVIETEGDAPVTIDPEAVIGTEEPRGPSVEEAFDDLASEPGS
jgi:hypothetical protein